MSGDLAVLDRVASHCLPEKMTFEQKEIKEKACGSLGEDIMGRRLKVACALLT